MTKDGRSSQSSSYRFGFQGQERNDEIAGEGVNWSFKYRSYNARYGRFFSVDPLYKKYPALSTYHFSHNSPIATQEVEGLEGADYRFRMLMYSKGGVQAEAERHADDIKIRYGGAAAEVMLGFVPYVGQAIDAKDTYSAFNGGDNWDIAFALVAWVPGGDLLKGFRKISKSVSVPSSIANARHLARGWDAPYKVGHEVVEFTTGKAEQFVRVFKNGENSAEGAWMMKKSDLYDSNGNILSSKEIQNKYSLDFEPVILLTCLSLKGLK